MTSAFPQWVSTLTCEVNYFQIESYSWSQCIVAGVGQLNPWPWSNDQWDLKPLLRWGYNRQFRTAYLTVTATITARSDSQTIYFHGESTN